MQGDQTMERRRDIRYAVRLDATYAVAGAALVHHASGETLDLSEHGCLLRVAATVAQGRRVRVAMSLPCGRVVVAGTVHWSRPEGQMGICFDRRVALPAQLQSYLHTLATAKHVRAEVAATQTSEIDPVAATGPIECPACEEKATTTQRIAGLPPLQLVG